LKNKNKTQIWISCIVALSFSSLNADVLNFSKVYNLALANSNDIKSSEYQTKSQHESINQAKSKLYPQVNFSAYYKKSDQKLNSATSTTSDDHIKQRLKSYSVSLDQSLYDQSLYSKISTEKIKAKVTQAKLDLKKQEFAHDVFKAYLEMLKSLNKINYQKSYLNYVDSKLETLEKKYKLHLANKMDLFEARVEKNSATIDLNKEEKMLTVNRSKLEKFIGKTHFELPSITAQYLSLKSIDDLKNSVIKAKDKIVESLSVKQALLTKKMTKEEINTAFDGHLPTVSLNTSYSRYDTDTPTTDAQYDNIKQIMVSIKIPIYSGGYTSSSVTQAKLAYRAANESLIDEQKKAEVTYNEQLASFDAASESVTMYKKAIESASLYVDALQQGYNHQLKSIVDLNEAKSKLSKVKYKYIQNVYDMVDSYIGLLVVTNSFNDITLLDSLIDN